MDPEAMGIHALVRRWTLDEFPLPGQLFEDTFELLYRDNRFMHGSLPTGERHAGIGNLPDPVWGVGTPAAGLVGRQGLGVGKGVVSRVISGWLRDHKKKKQATHIERECV